MRLQLYEKTNLYLIHIFLNSCISSLGPRKIDWKTEWSENHFRLEKLKNDILKNGSKKYKSGNNDFPDEFEYPFDEGFVINSYNGHSKIDTQKTTITFYMDRGLLDHYSAMVFTNDSTVMTAMDENVKNGGNDFKLKENWYVIND